MRTGGALPSQIMLNIAGLYVVQEADSNMQQRDKGIVKR
jgi:hypothetical protein